MNVNYDVQKLNLILLVILENLLNLCTCWIY